MTTYEHHKPEFLTADYGVPKLIADDLIQGAKEQEVVVPHCQWPENERAYLRAELLMKRVKALGYRHKSELG